MQFHLKLSQDHEFHLKFVIKGFYIIFLRFLGSNIFIKKIFLLNSWSSENFLNNRIFTLFVHLKICNGFFKIAF